MSRSIQMITILLTLLSSLTRCFANDKSDSLLVKECVLNYAEGWYGGEAIRMASSLHPDFEKAIPIKSPKGTYLRFSSYHGLVEGASNGTGLLSEEMRDLKYQLLEIGQSVAVAKITSAMFNDYIQLLKTGKDWRIINVIWNYGIKSSKYVVNETSLMDTVRIGSTVTNYIKAFNELTPSLFESAVAKEFSRVELSGYDGKGSIQFTRMRYSASLNECLNVKDHEFRVVTTLLMEVTDIMAGMALARIETSMGYEFLQLFKDGERWVILNSIRDTHPSEGGK